MAFYKITSANGKFDHVESKKAALVRAREIAEAPEGATEAELVRNYGITISAISKALARSVGFNV